jgi:poly(A) polymerase
MSDPDSIKTSPKNVARSDHKVSRKDISPEALKVLYHLKDSGYLGYLAGGGVRDLLLGRKPKDFDVVTDANPNRVRRIFRNCRLIGRRFRLAHVFFGEKIIEVATFRANSTPDPKPNAEDQAEGPSVAQVQPNENRHGSLLKTEDGVILRDNVFGTPEEDAIRRDFTINALFYNIDGFGIIDYVDGLKDLDAGIIRSIGDPRVRYQEDPVRMIRAIRFAAMLGFHIETNAYQAISEFREVLTKTSSARLYEEVLKLFMCGNSRKALDYLFDTGVLGVLFPKWNAWLAEDPDGRIGEARRACLQIDSWRQAGRPPTPGLLFSVLWGPFLESIADRRRDLRCGEAITLTIMQYLSELGERVQVPKRAGYHMAHIFSSRHRFSRTNGKQPARFAERLFFHDAFDYFKFSVAESAKESELVEWWNAYIAEHKIRRPESTSAQSNDPSPRSRRRRSRRPRRRPRGHHQSPKQT